MNNPSPQKSECPVAAGQIAEQSAVNTAILQQSNDQGKAVATLVAQFALAGHSVHELTEGGFIVCKFGYAKHCPDARALAGFAKIVGVRS